MPRMYGNINQKRFNSLPSCWVDPYFEAIPNDKRSKTDFHAPTSTDHLPASGAREKSISEALQAFAEHTTAHGPKLIALSRNTSVWMSRAFVLLTILCIIAAIFMTVEVTSIAFNDEIESTIRVEQAPRKGKKLPTIVLCNAGIFDMDAAEDHGLKGEMLTYVAASMLGPLYVTDSFKQNKTWRDSLNTEFQPILSLHGNMTELVIKLSYRCESLVVQCYNVMFSLSGRECCQTLFHRIITPVGVCFKSNFGDRFTQVLPGEGMGINIELNVPRHTEPALDWRILEEHLHTVSGLQISVVNSIAVPSLKVLGDRIIVQPNTKVSVAVDHSVTNNIEATRGLWPFSPPTCTPSDASPIELLSTMRNCFLYKIYLKFAGGNCSIPSLQSFVKDGLPVCTIEDQLLSNERPFNVAADNPFAKNDEDLCNLICEDEEFISRVIMLPLSAQASRGHGENSNRASRATVAVYYPSLSHHVTLQSKPNLENWFSKLGGDLGMCIGASVITIIEVILFLLYLLFLLFKKLSRKIYSILTS